jgi:hypothetical protein
MSTFEIVITVIGVLCFMQLNAIRVYIGKDAAYLEELSGHLEFNGDAQRDRRRIIELLEELTERGDELPTMEAIRNAPIPRSLQREA